MKRSDSKPTYKVRLRGGFSDRNNISIENRNMQYESLDDRTRAMLINMTSIVLNDVDFQRTQTFYKSIIIQVFAFEFDCSQICDEKNVKEIIYQTIRENTYDEVFFTY